MSILNSEIYPDSHEATLVAEIVNDMFTEYGYPNNLHSDKILTFASDNIVVVKWLSKNDAPYLIVFQTFNNEMYGLDELESLLLPDDKHCASIVFRSGGKTSFYKRNYITKSIEPSNDIMIYRISKGTSLNLKSECLSDKFESIFFEAHSFIRDIDGLHPDEALDELCKIIYTKLYDEEIMEQHGNCYFDISSCGNIEEYAAVIRKLYSDANEYDIRVYSLRIPGYKRSRGVFDDPIKLSTPALAKVSELFSRFSFSKSDIDIKARAFQNVYKPTTRAGMGQYFTPQNVIKFIVSAVQPTCDELVLDPFCGSAHFLTESINVTRQNAYSEKLKTDFIFHKLHGIEKSERMVRIAMTDMRLHGDGHSNIRCTDALLPFSSYFDIAPNSFDVIMTNPPFGSTLTDDMMQYIGDFELGKKRGKIPLEVLGLERCIHLLRNNGKLAIVLPESIFVNKSYSYVREWLKINTRIRAIISLPIETFTPYGASIKTSILFCSKDKTAHNKDYKIFSGGIDNIGYDATGKSIQGSDWEDLSIELKRFLGTEGW